MNKPSSSQAILYLIISLFILFILSSLFSFTFTMDEWNIFSNILFWGASITLTVWVLNDYFLNPGKKEFNGKVKNEQSVYKPNDDLINKETSLRKEKPNESFSETKQILKEMRERAEKINETMYELKRLNEEISGSDHKFERVHSFEEECIGDQTWSTINLNVDRFRNGDKIVEAKSVKAWKECLEQGIPAFCYYDNNKKHAEGYGKLYNYYAIVDPRGLAPEGWTIPSLNDWLRLNAFVKQDIIDLTVGSALKSANQVNTILGGKNALDIHPRWDENQDSVAADIYFFQALPGGYRGADEDASFSNIGKAGYWWTSSMVDNYGFDEVALVTLYDFSRELSYDGFSVNIGASVRLVKYDLTIEEEIIF